MKHNSLKKITSIVQLKLKSKNPNYKLHLLQFLKKLLIEKLYNSKNEYSVERFVRAISSRVDNLLNDSNEKVRSSALKLLEFINDNLQLHISSQESSELSFNSRKDFTHNLFKENEVDDISIIRGNSNLRKNSLKFKSLSSLEKSK